MSGPPTSAPEPSPTEARTRRDYFDAALAILADLGPEGLTVAALCERLGVDRGSFDLHFRGMPAFVDDLVADWESVHNDRLIELSTSELDPIRRLEVLRGIAVGLPHNAEAAIRAWSRSCPPVAEALARVDVRRELHFADSLVLLGMEPLRARRFARMGLAIIVGMQQMQRPVDHVGLEAMLIDFTGTLLGTLGRDPAP